MEEGNRILEQAVDIAEDSVDYDLDVETLLLTGHPTDSIVDRAHEANADAIFVGHRGMSAEQEEVVGSVAKSIVGKATVTVMVVH